MRILHLIPRLSAGGAERQLSYLASELAHRGHDIHIAYSNEGPEKPALNGVFLHKLNSLSNYDPYLLWQLTRLIRNVKPEIVQTWIPQMDILGGIAAKFCGRPFIFREPCSGLEIMHQWKNYLRVRIGSSARAVISNSHGGYEHWKTIVPDGLHYYISNALPIDEINATEPGFLPTIKRQNIPVVLYVSRLVEQKRPALFLEAVAEVRQTKNILGVMCGEGPLLPELKTLRSKLRLDDAVIFTDHLPAKSVWSLMKTASVLVSLSTYEGCSNTVMEAMACACPLVVSNIRANHEILDESSALFIDPLNIEQTVNAITNILKYPDDAQKRALSARQTSLTWSIAEMACHYESVYRECL